MTGKILHNLLIVFACFFLKESKAQVKPDSSGYTRPLEIRLPDLSAPEFPVPRMGAAAYADTVIMYDPGAPGANTGGEPQDPYRDPQAALGMPEKESGFVSLGDGGTLILGFTDNVILDGPGPDLCIMHADADTEEAVIFFSADGEIFLPAGRSSRSSPCVDISDRADPDQFYTMVKIRDHAEGFGDAPDLGCDIRGVSVLHSAKRLVIPADSVFQEGSWEMKAGAQKALQQVLEWIQKYPSPAVQIHVHTEEMGSEEHARNFSMLQAAEIRNYLLDRTPQGTVFRIFGKGNSSSDPHKKVEIFVKP